MNMNNVIEKIKTDNVINLISNYISSNCDGNNIKIYLVGGIIRDLYLGFDNCDKDIIVENTNAEVFARNLASFLNATFIRLDEENKIYRLILQDKKHCIDIAELMGKNIEEDLKRRDLTINSIALDLKTFEIFDYNNGIIDLKNKIIRGISEQNFIDDPLRMLRVYRFQATLGFRIDSRTCEIIKSHSSKIKTPAIERINYELLKLFSGEYSSNSILAMDESGLLTEFLPISQELKKVPPNLHHHLDLFMHSIEVVKQIQEIYENSSNDVKKHLEQIDFGGFSRLTHLKLSGFLHDIGKPDTWTIEEETGRHRFIKHDDVGAKMLASLLKKSKFSKKQIDYITKMVKFHIYPSHVISSPELSEKIYMRFIRKMGDDVIDIILLAMADRLSARGIEITEEVVRKNISGLSELLNFYLNIKETLTPLPKLLSGNEIMEILDIKPSRYLGKIIELLHEAQLAGDVKTKPEAISFIVNSKEHP